MEDLTSQAEEIPAKKTGKTGTPATQLPGKGASKRKGKKPRCKFSGIPPGRGAIYRPLPEESGTVPERK